MKKITTFVSILSMATMTLFFVALMAMPTQAATNAASDPGGGSQSLTASGNVTVNAAALQLVKQVYDSAGNCLASSPTDATCNSGATTVSVPAGTTLKFLIFVKNTTAIALTDLRFQDALDVSATGFTYVAASIRRTQLGASAPADTATAAAIFADANGATGTVLTDAASAVDEASFVSPNITAGSTANLAIATNANKAFGIVFRASKN